ncbi:MAG: aspartate aminotransferase family protein [Vicinamibacterales bacterium]
MTSLEALEARELATYLHRTPQSHALFGRARQVMPGGDTRTGTFYPPYPLFVARGEGCHVWDADGHQYLDVLNNFTSLVHGHGHTAVVRAIADQAAKGTVHGTANALQVALAEVLCRRVPSVERVRFCNSGTEATMGALRAARAFTGRAKILKMAGGYHGSHDQASVAASAPFDVAPPGVSPGAAAEVIVGRFNDLEATAALIRAHADQLAAVIVEPMTGTGALPADPGFLAGLREVTAAHGVLLVFDEVITFRLAPGGLQEVYGIRPDLTCFGKIIGGGLPVGAFGGRADVMAGYDPARPGSIAHSGTYNGNATTMAAGLATLRLFDGAAVGRLNAAGDVVRSRLAAAADRHELAVTVTGHGSIMQLHFAPGPIATPEQAARADRRLARLLHLVLLNRGVFTATRQTYVLSTVMHQAALDNFTDRVGEALGEIARALRAAPVSVAS